MTDDADDGGLNREWRGGNGATNVLSFPGDHGGPGRFLLGDVVLAFETIVTEAAIADISLADHLIHLVVHGVLHLLGYDHKTDAEADKMEALEREILKSCGIPDPYIVNRTEPYEAAIVIDLGDEVRAREDGEQSIFARFRSMLGRSQ